MSEAEPESPATEAAQPVAADTEAPAYATAAAEPLPAEVRAAQVAPPGPVSLYPVSQRQDRAVKSPGARHIERLTELLTAPGLFNPGRTQP